MSVNRNYCAVLYYRKEEVVRGDAEVGCGGCLGMEDRQQSAAWIRSNLFHILHLTRTSPALNGTEKNKVIGKRSGNRKNKL
jgi:hypothetical protein